MWPTMWACFQWAFPAQHPKVDQVTVRAVRHSLLQLEITYSHAEVGFLVFFLLSVGTPDLVSIDPVPLPQLASFQSQRRKSVQTNLVFLLNTISKGIQDFKCSLRLVIKDCLKYLEALWMLRQSSKIFLATGAGRGRLVGWLIDYWLGINTERVYAKAEGTMPSSQNKTLTANWRTRNCKVIL